MQTDAPSLRDPIDFSDLAPVEVPVNVGGKRYILLEAGAEAEIRYKNHLFAHSVPGPDGKKYPAEGFGDAEPLIISLCLYKEDRDGKLPRTKDGLPDPAHRVSMEMIKSWPNRIVAAIFGRLRNISGMGSDTVEELEATIREAERQIRALRNGTAGPKAQPVSSTGG